MLISNSMFEMDNEAIVIRIKTPLGDMDSSVDSASLLNFNDLMVAIRDVMPEATVTAFEYEDEVGDRITVRSDEELKAMLSYYLNTVNEQRMNGLLPDPLQIFPRAGKTPGIRNIHGLKVNTRPNPASDCTHAVSDSIANNSLKKSSAELKKILTNGQINAQDIHYQELLGHGNGGTVYKVAFIRQSPVKLVNFLRPIESKVSYFYVCTFLAALAFHSFDRKRLVIILGTRSGYTALKKANIAKSTTFQSI
uniref:Mitogen-activated protein kinase kinase 5 n=1 Tax=Oryzias sinensis TaxID=183150 RepID=A0A8C7XBK0_9TELE